MYQQTNDSYEKLPFIKDDTGESRESGEQPNGFICFWNRLSVRMKISIHLFMVLLNVSLFLVMIHSQFQGPVHPNNALRNMKLQWRPTMSITAGMSPYASGAEDAIDDAWHELMGNISIRVGQDELNQNGNHQTSVELPDGGGHLAWLGVFHQLHCLVGVAHMTSTALEC
ncbi:hypothetical protein G7054_g4415 [Neopestalotiopsis clavispora]|nr:hypothetical protein G7054_g4415 [Neopestalotiopsis clavispora]